MAKYDNLTDEEIQKAKEADIADIVKKCNHIGYHSPVAQNIISSGPDMVLLISHCCTVCGHLFTFMKNLVEQESAVLAPKPEIIKH